MSKKLKSNVFKKFADASSAKELMIIIEDHKTIFIH